MVTQSGMVSLWSSSASSLITLSIMTRVDLSGHKAKAGKGKEIPMHLVWVFFHWIDFCDTQKSVNIALMFP